MTINEFVNMFEQEIASHDNGWVSTPLTMDHEIVIVDENGDERQFSIEAAGGNSFEPKLVITVY